MTKRAYLLLFMLGFMVAIGVASLQSLPGYLDSDYYFAGGLQLVSGKGFSEPYIWNYLSEPPGLPHPSHTYWLPLSSILAAVSMFISGQHTYAGARLIFTLIAACVPPLTARLAQDLTSRRDLSIAAGLLAVFSIYHVPFLPVTDNFGPFMLLGGSIFVLMQKKQWWSFLLMGLLAGLLNLGRNDGLLWLGLLGLFSLWQVWGRSGPAKQKGWSLIKTGTLIVVGYFLVMAPWYFRNLRVFGSLMPPGGIRILWLTNYNDTFAFPAHQVNLQSWLAAGWGQALKTRLWALRMNALNAFGAQGGILLFPFILIGLWQLRKDVRVKLAAVGWFTLLFVMTIVFPFAGARGGFFHAGAAFQPLWWAVAPLGLERLVAAIRGRNWLDERAYVFFRVILVVISAVLTMVIVWIRIIQPGWQPEEELYSRVEQFLVEQGADSDAVVIVRNPPGYYLVSGRSAIVMPPGGPDTILALSVKYGADYFVLEPEGVLDEYQSLYERYDSHNGFTYLGDVEDARVYALEPME